ncbi:methyltransferase domain-containing protein [Thiomicrorhabdus sp. ZW0627]|uniref:class I SAM-dependent methyltransferase n=1 Tax=Thiomicrorhabdus sp. ZW0627 TaxID=3039774 RepID=UPI00243709E6|nr:methyltransferase domain-containing protein [Thiomicrorhabdus sp. ZW0627]MDG6772803.1 methyltransferase domain-containing protein [Thiomicrorhabdus sp. ZW0627]
MNQGFQRFLKQWYRTSSGHQLYKQEHHLIQRAVTNLFGYFFVQLGCTAEHDWVKYSRVSNKLILDDQLDYDLVKKGCVDESSSQNDKTCVHWVKADLDYLPIAKESADVVMLPHTLETVQDPHYLLRQVDAMLVPEGHLVLTGFNPYACAIVKSRLSKENKMLREANLVRSGRLIEWLEVLGYDIEKVEYSTISCYAGTTKSDSVLGWRILERFEGYLNRIGLQFGNVYCIVARKRVDAPRMVGLSWQRARWLKFAKPAQVISGRMGAKHHKIKVKEDVNCKR